MWEVYVSHNVISFAEILNFNLNSTLLIKEVINDLFIIQWFVMHSCQPPTLSITNLDRCVLKAFKIKTNLISGTLKFLVIVGLVLFHWNILYFWQCFYYVVNVIPVFLMFSVNVRIKSVEYLIKSWRFLFYKMDDH